MLKKILLIALLATMNFAHASLVNATVEFSVPLNTTITMQDYFTPVVRAANGNIYLIYVDTNFRPFVTQKVNGVVTSTPLDPNTDYTCYHDSHHRYSIGMDKNGYLHVAGDMHGYPGGPGNNAYLPARYQNQTIMYWISNKPYDSTAGFTFAGGLNASTAIPGNTFNTGHFVHDKNGELYYASMVRAFTSPTTQGKMGVGFYHYNASNRTWSALGGMPEKLGPAGAVYYPVLYWENSGFNLGDGSTDLWFQNYQPDFRFDNQNRLHFTVNGNIDPTTTGATRQLYAMSPDSGVTWYKASGVKIPGLPLRGVSSSPNVADVVQDSATGTILSSLSTVVADANGNPAVSAEFSPWLRWSSNAWIADVGNSHQLYGARAMLGPDNIIGLFEGNSNWGRRVSAFTDFSAAFVFEDFLPNTGGFTFMTISDLGLQSSGHYYGTGINFNTNLMQVVNVSFNNPNLPAGWAMTDIGTGVTLGGYSDYANGVLTQRSSGMGLAANADNFHFAYTTLTGDGSIVARVATQDGIRNAAGDGLMMRETLAANSASFAYNVLYQKQIDQITRSTTNGTAITSTTWSQAAPIWLKLTRAGNVFTAFYSADGKTWTAAGPAQTIVMASQIYIGVDSYAYTTTEEHTGTLDNLSFTPPAPPAPVCTHNSPSISISPSSQNLTGLDTANFTVTVVNKDSSLCPSSVTSLQTGMVNGNLTSFLEPYNLLLNPGQTGTSILAVYPQALLAAGAYQVQVSDNASASATATVNYQTVAGFQLSVSSARPLYYLTNSPQNVTLKATSILNNAPVANVPVTYFIYTPDSKVIQATGTTGTGTGVYTYPLTTSSVPGVYTFKTVATYNKVNTSESTTFIVK